VSRAPEKAEVDESSGYLEAFEQVFRLHERGKSFSGRERNCAFLNTGGRFADISAGSGLDFPDDARGLAAVDWDQDGDLDLWFANRTAPQLRFMRNDSNPENRFLRLRLEGRESNRDAIGARVEILLRTSGGEILPLVKTLSAGEGFLSQSSKWIHFGLGREGTVTGGTIRWPSGRTEPLPPVATDRHYRIVEGSGRALEWEPPPRTLALEIDDVEVPEPRTPARILFAARAPLPRLSFRSFDGADVDLLREDGQPLLVNLWATWCLPCVGELRDFTRSTQAIADSGLSIIALSVDGLDEEQATTAADAERFLADLGFPYAAGMADERLLTKLQILHDNLFSTHLAFAIPTSFLIDGEGRLAALYRGAVDVDRLVEDARNLGAPADRRRQMASPLPGRWLAPVQELRLTSFGQRFAEEGFPEEALRYLRLEIEDRPDDPDLRMLLAGQLLETGKQREAVSVLRHGIASGNRNEALVTTLAALLLDSGAGALAAGDLDRAADALTEALELVPDQVDALGNLGITRLEQGRLDDAERLLRRAIELDSTSPGAHNNLGIVLAQRGSLSTAVESFERALNLDPDFPDARANLEAVRRAMQPPE
jgi:Flp pilus assembly protein TadD/peroxiredoxin